MNCLPRVAQGRWSRATKTRSGTCTRAGSPCGEVFPARWREACAVQSSLPVPRAPAATIAHRGRRLLVGAPCRYEDDFYNKCVSSGAGHAPFYTMVASRRSSGDLVGAPRHTHTDPRTCSRLQARASTRSLPSPRRAQCDPQQIAVIGFECTKRLHHSRQGPRQSPSQIMFCPRM